MSANADLQAVLHSLEHDAIGFGCDCGSFGDGPVSFRMPCFQIPQDERGLSTTNLDRNCLAAAIVAQEIPTVLPRLFEWKSNHRIVAVPFAGPDGDIKTRLNS